MKFCRNKLVPEYITGKQELSKEDSAFRKVLEMYKINKL